MLARGVLLDSDSRWDIISQSVDDRTAAERKPPRAPSDASPASSEAAGSSSSVHPAMWEGGHGTQIKSRYDSISLYICRHLAGDHCTAAYNDVLAPTDEGAYKRLLDAGVDEQLARHIAVATLGRRTQG